MTHVPETPMYRRYSTPVYFGESLQEIYLDEMFHNLNEYGSLMREQIDSIMNDEWYESNKDLMAKNSPDLLTYVDEFRSHATDPTKPKFSSNQFLKADKAAKVKGVCETQLREATSVLTSIVRKFNAAANNEAAVAYYKNARDVFHQIKSLKLKCFDEPKILREFDDFYEMQQTMKEIAVAQGSAYESELVEKLNAYDKEKTRANYNNVFNISDKISRLLLLKLFETDDKICDKPQIENFKHKYSDKLKEMNSEYSKLTSGGNKQSANKSTKSRRSKKSRKTKSRKTKSRRH